MILTCTGNLSGMLEVHKNTDAQSCEILYAFLEEVLKTVKEFMALYLIVCLDLCLSNGTKEVTGSVLKKHQNPTSWNTIFNDWEGDTNSVTVKQTLLHSFSSKIEAESSYFFI